MTIIGPPHPDTTAANGQGRMPWRTAGLSPTRHSGEPGGIRTHDQGIKVRPCSSQRVSPGRNSPSVEREIGIGPAVRSPQVAPRLIVWLSTRLSELHYQELGLRSAMVQVHRDALMIREG